MADAARSMFLWLWQPATPQVMQVFSVDVGADGQVSIVKQDAGVALPPGVRDRAPGTHGGPGRG